MIDAIVILGDSGRFRGIGESLERAEDMTASYWCPDGWEADFDYEPTRRGCVAACQNRGCPWFPCVAKRAEVNFVDPR